MLIQVDVDSTLYDFNKLAVDVAKEFGVTWPKKYYTWFGPEAIGTDLSTLKNIFRRCHSREVVMQQKPYPEAATTLARIAQTVEDVEIAYVSDRNEQQTGALREWLQDNKFLFNEDQFVAATKDKRHWMRERKPEIVIDDRVRTMLMARFELGSQVVSLEHPHNMNLVNEADGIYIVKDWKQIDDVLWHTILPALNIKTLSRTKELAQAGR